MEQSEIERELHAFISRELLRGEGGELDNQSPLLEWGVLDSLNLVTLVNFLRERFAVNVPGDAINAENFGSISAIRALVQRLNGAAATGS